MNDQTLERLMIDRSLGALSDDVNELLAAFADTQPDYQRRLTQWNDTGSLVNQALRGGQNETAPPFPIGIFQRNRIWHAGRLALAAAAVLAVGIGIGLRTPRESSSHPPLEVAVADQRSQPTPTGVHDFWSSSRLVAVAADQPQRQPSNLIWTSPVTQPQIGVLR